MQQRLANAFSWYSANICKIIFWTSCMVLILLLAERFLIIFSFEGHTAGIDNNFDYPVIRSLAGFSMYPNPSAYPYAVNPYAPLFFIVCKWVAEICNVKASDTINIYRVTRTVALLADTATCILFYFAVQRHTKSRAISAVVAALFFSVLCYLGYTINRADALFLLFYTITIVFLLISAN